MIFHGWYPSLSWNKCMIYFQEFLHNPAPL
jgi:hypothetical protein